MNSSKLIKNDTLILTMDHFYDALLATTISSCIAVLNMRGITIFIDEDDDDQRVYFAFLVIIVMDSGRIDRSTTVPDRLPVPECRLDVDVDTNDAGL